MDLTGNITTLLASGTALKGFLAYCAACFIGQLGNASWLYLNREIPCVMDRFRQDVRATIRSLIANFGAIAAVALLIPFDTMPLQAALVMGAMQGFSSDSAINKNTRKIWTDEERAAAQPNNPEAKDAAAGS